MYKSFYVAMALDGMDFSMNEGEIRCLIGENGCGKSTMIKVISGFHPFDSGELYINDKPYKKITPSESIAEGIQVIYQDFSLFPNMTIAENIMVYSTVAKGEVVNSVGAGDSMVAGFVSGYLKTGSYEEALRLGAASGGATAFSSDLATREFIDKLVKEIKVEKIR